MHVYAELLRFVLGSLFFLYFAHLKTLNNWLGTERKKRKNIIIKKDKQKS